MMIQGRLSNFFQGIHQLFEWVMPGDTPGVYEIPCSRGSVYIGEKSRLIKSRRGKSRFHNHKEHIRQPKNQ